MGEERSQTKQRHWLDAASLLISSGALLLSLLSYISANRSVAVAEEANRNNAQQNAQYVSFEIRDLISGGGVDRELVVLNTAKTPAYNVWIEVRDAPEGKGATLEGPQSSRVDRNIKHLGIVEACTQVALGVVALGKRPAGLYGFVHYTDSLGRQWVRRHNGGQPDLDDGRSWPTILEGWAYTMRGNSKRSAITSC
ncbi:hypothetical protein ACGFJ7_00295 [Actinoplanes sp. NPDC048988]|uniref:hypothetical protein n=1 Tax=Actinoplanes sp. NPDC048988 TaxID=3363901 RepID=UPI003722E385